MDADPLEKGITHVVEARDHFRQFAPTTAATKFGLSLGQIAAQNLAKYQDR